MLGELSDHLEEAEEVTTGIALRCPEYRAMAEAVCEAAEMVAMAYDLEAYGEGRGDD